MDMLVVLLVTNERDFHVERIHGLPQIVHAANFDDLEHVPLAAKMAFLERNGLKETSKFIDRLLRNDIAHLDFNIDEEGKISTKNYGNVNIFERINTFTKKLMIITLILSQEGLDKIITKAAAD